MHLLKLRAMVHLSPPPKNYKDDYIRYNFNHSNDALLFNAMREIRFDDYYIMLYSRRIRCFTYILFFIVNNSTYNIVYTILYAVIIYNNYIK